MSECRDCKFHIIISAVERCERVHVTDADGNPTYGAAAFQRTDFGVHGWPHCGPEGKYWEGRV